MYRQRYTYLYKEVSNLRPVQFLVRKSEQTKSAGIRLTMTSFVIGKGFENLILIIIECVSKQEKECYAFELLYGFCNTQTVLNNMRIRCSKLRKMTGKCVLDT